MKITPYSFKPNGSLKLIPKLKLKFVKLKIKLGAELTLEDVELLKSAEALDL